MSFMGPLSSYTIPAVGFVLPFVAGMAAKGSETPPPEQPPHDPLARTQIVDLSLWQNELLARHRISPADVIRLERRDLFLRTARTASFWAAVAVFPGVVPVPLPLYQVVVGSVALLSILRSFRILFQFDWRRPENRKAFQRADEEATRLGDELENLLERGVPDEAARARYLELRRDFGKQVRRMERIGRSHPESILQRNLTMGVYILFATLMETLFVGRPDDEPLMALVSRRHKTRLARLPESLPLLTSHAYRGITSGKTPV